MLTLIFDLKACIHLPSVTITPFTFSYGPTLLLNRMTFMYGKQLANSSTMANTEDNAERRTNYASS